MTAGSSECSRSEVVGAPGLPSPTVQAGRLRTSRPAAVVLAAVVALMVVSSVAHLWSLHRDLPLTDPDEATFVTPAVHMAASGDLNPHWFGHPGSTVIYPLAGLFHAWDAFSHGPLLSSNPALTARLEHSPTTFYVIGRLWTIALSVGALPLLFLVGRRAFNTRVALIAAAIWAVLPLPVQFGRVVRTDSAGVFFGLLALWLCLRLLDEPRIRWCVLAGLSVGLAVASRYFMVALVPVLVAAAVVPHRGALRRAFGSALVALASAVAGFAVSTPFFFLDWRTALDSLTVEDSGAVGAHSSSPLGNLYWYLRVGIPESMTWPLAPSPSSASSSSCGDRDPSSSCSWRTVLSSSPGFVSQRSTHSAGSFNSSRCLPCSRPSALTSSAVCWRD
jgi:4-amino-4-deoxy-L-arabinose transferase-like glycosyltransferase